MARAGRLVPYELTAPALVYITIVLLLPLGLTLRLSFLRYDALNMYVDAFTFENYLRFFHDAFYQNVLLTTLWISAVTTVLCLVGGVGVAYFMARNRSRILQRYLVIVIVLPLFVGNVTRTAGWIVLLNDGGVANYLLQRLNITAVPLRLLYTPGAVIAGLASVLLPYMIVTLNSVMHNIDVSLEEASLNLGASALTTFRRIVLPLMAPGLFAGSLLCFILSLNAYATPVLLGGPRFYMMAPTIYSQMSASLNWPFGAALAFVLITLTVILTVLSSLLLGRPRARAAR